jgi:HAD superfamily hydrolase (TIGR01509 family)
VRLRKPDAEIYLLALRQFGLEAADAIFVDDLVENVDAANDLGMTGILFQGAVDLRRELTQLGLLV